MRMVLVVDVDDLSEEEQARAWNMWQEWGNYAEWTCEVRKEEKHPYKKWLCGRMNEFNLNSIFLHYKFDKNHKKLYDQEYKHIIVSEFLEWQKQLNLNPMVHNPMMDPPEPEDEFELAAQGGQIPNPEWVFANNIVVKIDD